MGHRMAINIKHREVETLLDELKAQTGKGTTQIVLELLRQEVALRQRSHAVAERRRRVEEIRARYSARLGEQAATPDEVVGYDQHGLPA